MFCSTLRGLTVGSLLVAPKNSRAPCLVFGSSFCGWLPVLEQLGFTPVGVILHTSICLSLVRAWVPSNCRVIVDSAWHLGEPLPLPCSPGLVGFLDWRFSSGVARLMEHAGIRDIWSCRGQRRRVPGWVAS